MIVFLWEAAVGEITRDDEGVRARGMREDVRHAAT
jgi:hypothetical protein